MELREGRGSGGSAREGDEVGVVWVVDSARLPFYRAERYHQFHPGECLLWGWGVREWGGQRRKTAPRPAATREPARTAIARRRHPTHSLDRPSPTPTTQPPPHLHPGLGFESFPASYTRDLKAAVAATGKIDPTGCPELPF
jgi:hypothetical protein